MAGPNSNMEICFSFDTTESMSGCINEVKEKVQDLIKGLQANIPGIRMGLFAHGDYCDKHKYHTKHIDFYKHYGDDTMGMLHNNEQEVRARGSNIHKDLDALFGKWRSDAEIMDTCPSPLSKIPSLTKPPSVKVLKASQKPVVKVTKKPKSPRFKRKHTSLIDKRQETLLEKYKLKNLPKLKRENVPDKNFMLNDIPWTKWQVVMANTMPEAESALWEKRSRDSVGYRRKVIFGGKYNKPSLYEFSVQKGGNCKRSVVYCKSSKGFILNKGSWESRLLSKASVKSEINDILKKLGGKIFARRCSLRKSSTLMNKTLDLKHYDYAWCCQGNKDKTAPRVV